MELLKLDERCKRRQTLHAQRRPHASRQHKAPELSQHADLGQFPQPSEVLKPETAQSSNPLEKLEAREFWRVIAVEMLQVAEGCQSIRTGRADVGKA